MSDPEIIELDDSQQALRQQMAALQADFGQLRTDLVALTKVLGELSKRRAEESVVSLQQVGNQAADRVRAAAAEAVSLGDAGIAATERHVAEHPISSLLVAFASGLVFGKLVEKR
jgi:ElaB/YqjD/DUF883 family membrane-anchored ribosome-binding protein